MNTIRKSMSSVAFAFVLFVLCALPARADGTYGQYGGETAQGKVLVDKLVRNPQTGEYVDNLGLSDPKYFAENAVFFKIVVQNTGSSTLSSIKVEDILPPYVSYVSGGDYNEHSRITVFTFKEVQPGERRSEILQVKAYPEVKLPGAKTIVCPTNKVIAYSVEDGTDEDTAQFCIEKRPMASRVPETGDPMGLALAIGAIPTLFAGFKLRKLSQ